MANQTVRTYFGTLALPPKHRLNDNCQIIHRYKRKNLLAKKSTKQVPVHQIKIPQVFKGKNNPLE